MVWVVLCPGALEGSTDRGSGSKNISEDGRAGDRTLTPWYKANNLYATPRRLTFCGCSLEAGKVYVFVV